MIDMILKYINFYLHRLITKIALRQRYTNSQLFLGDDNKARTNWLADAINSIFKVILWLIMVIMELI